MPDFYLGSNKKIHYLEINPEGHQPTLLLHGLGATEASWRLQFPSLVEANFHIYAPDLRGFGKSTYPGGEMSVKSLAKDTANLLYYLKATPAHVIGISMGGTVALQLAIDEPQIVDKLVLVNTFASLRPKRLDTWIYFLLRFIAIHTLGLAAQAKIATKRLFPQPDQDYLRKKLYNQIIQADPRAYRAIMRALAKFNANEHLAQIDTPTLIVSGREDSTVPLKNQIYLSSEIPKSKHVIISNSGHAVIVEKPEEFNQEMINFLTS